MIDAIRLKIERADEHLKLLESELARYYATHPAEFVPEGDVHRDELGGEYVFGSFKVDAPPPLLAMIMGDALQNLRSALDYLIWELVAANHQTPGEYNAFPICRSEKEFMTELGRNRMAGVNPDVIAEVARLQPYFDGADVDKSFLWTLHHFANINKHRRILLTRLKTMPIPPGFVTSQDAQGLVHAMVNPPPTNIDTKVGPVPIVDGKVQMNPAFIGYVIFDEGPPKGYEVWAFLEATSRFIPEHVLPHFERFF
ncbi:MAG: hypothetical protein WAL45_13555 [Terracidiphilus sp.]